MKRDHNVKMRHKEELLKSKDERLKLIQEREKKTALENNELCKAIATKEAEALSALDVLQDNARIEQENNTLCHKMLELEEDITGNKNSLKAQMSNVKRLKRDSRSAIRLNERHEGKMCRI